tara:strand:+ start:8147 stop:9922 length:1776 start_codon:yes stop_codon:yes gene_type:complete
MSINIDVTLPTSTSVTVTGIDVEVTTHFILDRYLGDELTLPYGYDEIKIKSNDSCIANNINASFFKLHYNFLYLNGQTRIASNNFPTVYAGFIAGTKSTGTSGVGWHLPAYPLSYLRNELSAYGDGTTSGSTILSGLIAGAFTQSLGSKSKSVGFVANSGTLLAFHTDTAVPYSELKLQIKTIEDRTALPFTEIRSLVLNSDKNLLVLDNVLIHKFDVTGVLTDNPATSGIGRFLIKTIGGLATSIYDKDKFNSPVSIDVGKDDKVYVLDKGHSGYKIYDKDLNWISTSSKRNDFVRELQNSPVVDISVDKKTEHIYILSKSGTILEYDDNNFLVDTHVIEDGKGSTEEFKQLEQSRINDDILYVMTTSSLFKKFKTKLSKSIGAFRLQTSKITPVTGRGLCFVDVMDTDDIQYDYTFLGTDHVIEDEDPTDEDGRSTAVNSDVGAVCQFNENVNHQTISRDTYKTDVFSLSSVNIDGNEYVTSWVINKSLHKFLYNHLLFRESLFGKFISRYDEYGRPEFLDVEYLTELDDNLFDYQLSLDNFVGLNEVVLAETVNRPLKKIYELQETLLKMCKEKYINSFPLNNQIVGI